MAQNLSGPVMATDGFLSDTVQAVYDRMLLTRATQNELFDIGAQTRSIKKNSNARKAFAYRYKGMLPALTPLKLVA